MSAETKPTANQPGTLLEQFLAIGVYLEDSSREQDHDAAWQRARARIIRHAAKTSLPDDRWRNN